MRVAAIVRGAGVPAWLLAGLAFWLLLGFAVLANAASVTVGAQAELVVESVKADAYPRVTARFRVEPAVGKPPTHLDLSDVVVLEAGVRKELLEVYVVGRAPTERVGAYEAVWTSTASVQPGESVAGRLIVARLNRGDVEGDFRFTRPRPKLAESVAAQQRRVELQAVPLPSTAPPNVGYVGAVAGILAGVATLSVAAAMVWRARVRREQERLAIWVGGSAPMRAREVARAKSRGQRRMPLSPLIVQLGKLGARLVTTSQAEKIKRNLVLAGKGSPQEYTRFVAIKLGLALLLLVAGFWLMVGRASLLNAVALAGCMGLMGFLLPSMWLGKKIAARKYSMRKSLPDALDLMTIGVSAGLAFDGAISEIVNKWDNDLSREFSLMLGELRMGTGRREALLNLADRTKVDEIQTMVGQLIQSEELGMSLAETLLTLSNQMRLKRRQHAEELAQKAAVKMLIPLVFLIFPALFIVILGPAAQDMMGFMSQGK